MSNYHLYSSISSAFVTLGKSRRSCQVLEAIELHLKQHHFFSQFWTIDLKMPTITESRSFIPYETAALESPMLHLLVERAGFLLRTIYRVRWFLTRPVQWRILPKCAPVIDLPVLRSLPYATVGQLILMFPLIAIFGISFEATWMDPAKTSGQMAMYAMLATFLLANKSNSVLSFMFGLSYERLVPIHNLAALLTLLLSCFHARVAFVNTVKVVAAAAVGQGGDSLTNGEADQLLQFNGRSGNGGRQHPSDTGLFHSNIPEAPSFAPFEAASFAPFEAPTFAPFQQDISSSQGGREQEKFAAEAVETTPWEFLWDGYINVTGTLALLCVALLVGFSFFRVFRKYGFDFWLILHIVLAIFCIIFCIAHKGNEIGYAVVWWLLDWFLRKVVMAMHRFPRKAYIRKMPSGDVVELRMERFDFRAGQYIRIAIPELGTLFFHPFTISSAPHDPEVVIHIKAMGDWTRRILELTSRRKAVEVLVEGPYGGISMDLDNDKRYPIVLCVAGGIGITPCRSIAHQLLDDKKRGRRLGKLQVVWSVRDLAIVRDLPIAPVTSDTSKPTNIVTVAGNSSYATVLVDSYIDEEQASSSSGSASSTGSGSILQTDIFLTEGGDEVGGADQINLQFPCSIHYGRPNISKILSDLAMEAQLQGVARIAVVSCGPKGLVDQVKKFCRSQSNRTVSFDLHEEIFDY